MPGQGPGMRLVPRWAEASQTHKNENAANNSKRLYASFNLMDFQLLAILWNVDQGRS